ncbi:hypothetical protein MPH_08671 [Macrophomina phaseolina MS6]|uniref:Uncharacterized protein n=1 Tax=Macrophomina phaseolina (strain MS6) TaxID=1126212 RepID=K2RMX1_MACPH|nr:hypothetical protein MPH_08671 [Macrophomina phaseolina MS6]
MASEREPYETENLRWTVYLNVYFKAYFGHEGTQVGKVWKDSRQAEKNMALQGPYFHKSSGGRCELWARKTTQKPLHHPLSSQRSVLDRFLVFSLVEPLGGPSFDLPSLLLRLRMGR